MIEASGVTKVYGERRVVEEVSFSVARGEILGFLGPNGAGKTTTMRILTGFVPPTQGTARIAGFDILDQPIEAKKRLGYLPEHPPLYDEMLVRSFLEFVATIRGVARSRVRAQVHYVGSQHQLRLHNPRPFLPALNRPCARRR